MKFLSALLGTYLPVINRTVYNRHPHGFYIIKEIGEFYLIGILSGHSNDFQVTESVYPLQTSNMVSGRERSIVMHLVHKSEVDSKIMLDKNIPGLIVKDTLPATVECLQRSKGSVKCIVWRPEDSIRSETLEEFFQRLKLAFITDDEEFEVNFFEIPFSVSDQKYIIADFTSLNFELEDLIYQTFLRDGMKGKFEKLIEDIRVSALTDLEKEAFIEYFKSLKERKDKINKDLKESIEFDGQVKGYLLNEFIKGP